MREYPAWLSTYNSETAEVSIGYRQANVMNSQSPFLPRGGPRFRRWPRGLSVLIALCVAPWALPVAAAPSASFQDPETSPITVNEGHISLRWAASNVNAEEPVTFQLEQTFGGTGTSTHIAYSGSDTGTFVSGLPSTGATFRVRAQSGTSGKWGTWSQPLEVKVNYPARWQVTVLSTSGAAMFLILLSAIVYGTHRTSRSAENRKTS